MSSLVSLVAAESFHLIVFPHAGGSVRHFLNLKEKMPAAWGLSVVQLPGREERSDEAFFDDWPSMINELSSELLQTLQNPFLFFGHSMGALLGYEVLLNLEHNGSNLPEHEIVVSCMGAPSLHQEANREMANLPDDVFLNKLIQLGGIPEALLKNHEMIDYLLPILRADFSLLEKYKRQQTAALNCDLEAFCSRDDTLAPFFSYADWENYTKKNFQFRVFPGGHFGPLEQTDLWLNRKLQNFEKKTGVES